jgi:hypothetical protein
MKVKIKKKVEGFYFNSESEHNTTLAVGGIKTVNGICISEWGKITKYKWIRPAESKKTK